MISCSIVLYKNDLSILNKAIESILSLNVNFILFLVDNSPTDDLRIYFTDERIVYIHNPSNPGFGASHNLAIIESISLGSVFHLVLNPDVYFERGSVEKIIDFMEQNIGVGLLMPQIRYPNEKLQYLCKTNPNLFVLFARGFLPHRIQLLFKKRLDTYQYKNFDYNEIIFDVPYLSGCFMFFRTSALISAGFFDEDFFMYLEDADISRRILKYNRTVYYPNVKVYHHYAGLTHKLLKFKWITIQSAYVYFNKWGWLNSIW